MNRLNLERIAAVTCDREQVHHVQTILKRLLVATAE